MINMISHDELLKRWLDRVNVNIPEYINDLLQPEYLQLLRAGVSTDDAQAKINESIPVLAGIIESLYP